MGKKMSRRLCLLGLILWRPCKAFLWRRVREWNARNVIARPIMALYNGASPNFTARTGVSVGEDAAKMEGW
jgi:hypothetical protein